MARHKRRDFFHDTSLYRIPRGLLPDRHCPAATFLARDLGIPRYAAIGLVMELWFLALDRAPYDNGDFRKWGGDGLALAFDYSGDPDLLLEALIRQGFLEHIPDAPGGLRIPGWDEAYTKIVKDPWRLRRLANVEAAGGYIRKAVRLRVFERAGHACLQCGARERLSIDHITPISLGGTNAEDNLQCLCKPCNSRKKDRVEAV